MFRKFKSVRIVFDTFVVCCRFHTKHIRVLDFKFVIRIFNPVTRTQVSTGDEEDLPQNRLYRLAIPVQWEGSLSLQLR